MGTLKMSARRLAVLVLAGLAVVAIALVPKQVEAATGWVKIRTLLYNDAEIVDAAALAKTITLTPITMSGGAVEIEDCYIDVVVAFARTTDGGPTTSLLDIGVSGATEAYAKDVSLRATGKTLGSSTTSVKPRVIHTNGVAPQLVITQTAGDAGAGLLQGNNAGRAVIFCKMGALPRTQ